MNSLEFWWGNLLEKSLSHKTLNMNFSLKQKEEAMDKNLSSLSCTCKNTFSSLP
jgi:hypothetical protein